MTDPKETERAEIGRVAKRLSQCWKGTTFEVLYDRLYPQDPRRYARSALARRLEQLVDDKQAHFDGTLWWHGPGEHVATPKRAPVVQAPVVEAAPAVVPPIVVPLLKAVADAPIVEPTAQVTSPKAEVTAPPSSTAADVPRRANGRRKFTKGTTTVAALPPSDVEVLTKIVQESPGRAPMEYRASLGWHDHRWHAAQRTAKALGRIHVRGLQRGARYYSGPAETRDSTIDDFVALVRANPGQGSMFYRERLGAGRGQLEHWMRRARLLGHISVHVAGRGSKYYPTTAPEPASGEGTRAAGGGSFPSSSPGGVHPPLGSPLPGGDDLTPPVVVAAREPAPTRDSAAASMGPFEVIDVGDVDGFPTVVLRGSVAAVREAARLLFRNVCIAEVSGV